MIPSSECLIKSVNKLRLKFEKSISMNSFLHCLFILMSLNGQKLLQTW